jgi:hypothetical protein
MKRVLVPVSLLVAILAGLSLAWAQHDYHNSGAHGVASVDKDQREFVRTCAIICSPCRKSSKHRTRSGRCTSA